MTSELSPHVFEGIVGPRHVAEATPRDAVDDVVPTVVVTPADVDELQAVLRAAHERSWSIIARGHGRHLALGNPPRRLDVVLSLERLDHVVSHEPADMTVRVQAGCTLTSLNDALSAAGQWLPLDPPFATRTSIGGLLATNANGPLRTSQGSARDLVIGLRTIAPDGTIVSGGGRVVKNVAGYDLPKMHIGALGTLGIVLDATFKVRPRPTVESAVRMQTQGPAAAAKVAFAARDAAEPFWLQISGSDAGWQVVAAAGGRPEDVDATLEAHRRVAQNHGLETSLIPDAAATRHELADAAALPGDIVLRAAILSSETAHVLDLLSSAAAQNGTRATFLADPLGGVVRAALPAEAGESARRMILDLRPRLESSGGHLILERAAARDKRALADEHDVWGDPGPGLPLMQRLKANFDPTGQLAPGRFVGGI